MIWIDDWGYLHDSDDSGNLHMAASTTTSYFDVNYMGTTGYKISTPHIFAGLSKQWTILSSLGCAKTAAHPFSKPTCKWGSPIGLWTTLSTFIPKLLTRNPLNQKKINPLNNTNAHTHTTKSGCWFSLITQKKKSIEDRHSSYGLNIKPSTKKSINWLERSIIYERAVAR